MTNESPLGKLSGLSASTLGVFRGSAAVDLGVSRKQLSAMRVTGVIDRELPDTYRVTAALRSSQQRLRAALLWAGHGAAAAGRSAGELYGLEGVHAAKPEIVVPTGRRLRSERVIIRRGADREALMLRSYRGVLTTGVEPTLVMLASTLTAEASEIACEDARRRRLTSIPALSAYLSRFGRAGRPGVGALRELLVQLDPEHPARSTLQGGTRRLLLAHGLGDFTREFPLEWRGRKYAFDFAFLRERVILETNGRRWHDDPTDYEYDNEKWSVPGRHGYRIILATWSKVTRHPDQFIHDIVATMAA